MNKAFVREPDATDPLCPVCGSVGEAVERETLASLVREEALQEAATELRESPYYCPLATCTVVYFDALQRSLGTESLKAAAYPKDPTAPICPCFGLTCESIEKDLVEGHPTRTRAAVKRASTEAADCVHRNVSGKSCVGEVQRYYVRRQAELG